MNFRRLLVLLALLFAFAPDAFAQRTVNVRGYTRKDGTYVQPHVRTAPNGTTADNWSTKGNVNPYTGEPGTKDAIGSVAPAAASPTPLLAQQPAFRYTTTALRHRLSPAADAVALQTIPQGRPVQVRACSEGWCEVSYAGVAGYSAERYLSERAPASRGTAVGSGAYTNAQGERVRSPSYSANGRVPAGASAQCRDGTYSFSRSRRGTCSHHGGVARWM